MTSPARPGSTTPDHPRETGSTPPVLPSLLALGLGLAGTGCVDPVTLDEPAVAPGPAVGEARTLELRFLPLDVHGFEKSLGLADLRSMPPGVLDRTWLLDLDIAPLLTNTLERVAYLPLADAYRLPRPARNLWGLLDMTANNADLEGTRFEGLLQVGEAVGLPPGRILADLVGGDPDAPVVPISVVVAAAQADVIATHPNAQRRPGPVDAAHPDGLYPVTPGAIPVSLGDVVDDFAHLAPRYGPARPDPAHPGAPRHPGFLLGASPLVAAESDLAMTVRVNLDALPYDGLDLSAGLVGAVNSTRSQLGTLFDFADPAWLTLQGLAPALTFDALTLAIHEDDQYLPPGTSRQPLPLGDSPAWAAPPWEFEHLLIDAAHRRAASIPAHCTSYGPQGNGGGAFQAVTLCLDGTGWMTIDVDPSVVLAEPPPPPSYFWDLLVEVAQVRLHDGGLAEGRADIEVTARDVPVGVATADLVATARANLRKDPASLGDLAQQLNDTSAGDPDLYYLVPGAATGGPAVDYLYFVAPSDVRVDPLGNPVRPYAYAHPGFFADEGLTRKVSSRAEVGGDREHEKVPVAPGMTLYVEDDQARLFSLAVGDKADRYQLSLTFTRLR